jgi:hypothetical protein
MHTDPSNIDRASLERQLLSALSDLLQRGTTDVAMLECVRCLAATMRCSDGGWRYSSASALHVASTYAPMRYRLWSEGAGRRDVRTEASLLAVARAVEEAFWRGSRATEGDTGPFGADVAPVLRALLAATDDAGLLERDDVRALVLRNREWTRSSSEVVPRTYVALRDYLWFHSAGRDPEPVGDADVRTWLEIVGPRDVEQATAVATRLARRYASNWLFATSTGALPWSSRVARGHTAVEVYLVAGTGGSLAGES